MSVMTTIQELRGALAVYWGARSEQEQRVIGVGAAVLLAALLYATLIAPAVSGRAALEKSLPQLRQQAAQLQAMAAEAGELARLPVPQLQPMARDALHASLSAQGLTPSALSMTGEFAKIELKDAPFAAVVAWLDAQRRENRVSVQDASVLAQTQPGLVTATLVLRQDSGTAP